MHNAIAALREGLKAARAETGPAKHAMQLAKETYDVKKALWERGVALVEELEGAIDALERAQILQCQKMDAEAMKEGFHHPPDTGIGLSGE